MDIAAGVVGLVSLSGQILQGCNYLCKTFFDVADAPDVIVAVSMELCAVRSQLQAFQRLLLTIQASAPACFRVQQDPGVPLQSCQNAIQKLQSFVDKYANLTISKTPNSSILKSHKTTVRKAWQKFDVARRCDQLRGHVSQLEAAKSSLLAVQTSIQLALQLQHLDVTREAQRSLWQLQDEHVASAQNVKETRNLATDVHNLQKDSYRLAKITNLSLEKIVSTNQRLLIRSASSEQYAFDAKTASHFTQDAITSLSTNLVKRFDNLPMILAPIIQDTITKSLAIHGASRETEVPSTNKRLEDMTANLCKENNNSSFPVRISSEKRLPRYESASSLLREKSPIVPTNSVDQTGVLIYSPLINKQGPKRQKTNKSVFNVWFGRIELTSSATEQEDDIHSGYPFPIRLQAQRTSFRLIPNSWFLRFGLLFEIGKIKPTISHPGWDNRLRVFRSHQSDSLIRDAIRRADYMSFRQLLESREVTPFDLVDSGYSTMKPLFETVVDKFELQTAAGNHAMQRGLLEIAKLLADLGADSGAGRSLFWALSALNYKADEFSLSLYRIIMAQSQTDPFEESAWSIIRTERRGFSLSVLTKQDEWDLSEFTKLVEDYWGNGSFHFMIANGASCHEWRKHQKQKWRRIPVHLRGSKSDCVAAFGWSFVEEIWGKLCWTYDKPALWRSREACEDLFGAYFIRNIWPILRWKEELPSFWRSREACLEAFGSFFIWYKWPELCWRQELPTFWHSRKGCQEVFGEQFTSRKWPGLLGKTCFEFLEGNGAWEQARQLGWNDTERDEWITRMIKRWSKADIPKEHTRQYCIDQYGVSFVREKLPYLLRQDGLPEEVVVRLTGDGLDMEPPPPHSRWKDEDESSAECGEAEESRGKYDTDSNAGSNEDSDDELSAGWQTADED